MILFSIKDNFEAINVDRGYLHSFLWSFPPWQFMSIPDEQIIVTPEIQRHSLYQFAADIIVPQPSMMTGVFREVIDTVYDWLQEHLPIKLDQNIRQCDGYTAETDFPTLFCEAVFDEHLWGIRLTQPSPPFVEKKTVAERTWTTDIALRQDGEILRFGIHICSISTGTAIGKEADCAKPALIDQLVFQHVLRDGRRLNGKPWILSKKNDIRRFYELLISTERTLPVLLLTQADSKRYPHRRFRFTLDNLELARLGIGIAHVVCLPTELESDWSQMVGGAWSAGRGAVRIYWPQIDFENDSPANHPIAVPNRPGPWPGIRGLNWEYQGGTSDDFQAFLLNGMLRREARQMRDWSGFLFCREIQARRYQLKWEKDAEEDKKRAEELAKIQSKDDLCKALSETVKHINSQIKDLKAEHARELGGFEVWIHENKRQLEVNGLLIQSYEKQLEEEKTANYHLRVMNDSLRASLDAKPGNEQRDIPVPDNYEEMDEWVKTQLAGRLVLHPRAVNYQRKAVYEDIALVYKALLLLATAFRDMKMHPALTEKWETERTYLGLHFGSSISETELGKYKDDYTVIYPLHTSKRRFAEYHLRKGVSRDERYCLAIYFFWDDDSKQVVVTWLPSHLDNRLS